MTPTTQQWQELASGSWLLPYGNRAAGSANCLALLSGPEQIAVISPAQGMREDQFTWLEARGKVTALLAPGGHDLGQAEWQARYPDAGTFAPANTIRALAKKRNLRPFEPLLEMPVDSGSPVRFVDAPGSKVGSLLAAANGVRYIDEIVGNHTALPPNWMFALLFRTTGSAPGIRLNRVYTTMFGSDKRALARTVLDTLEGATHVVLAHGPALEGDGIEAVRSECRRIS